MRHILDLQRYPLDRLDSEEAKSLIGRCKADLAAEGMFNLPGFVRADAIARCATDVAPRLKRDAHTHRRSHNVYFLRDVPGLSPDHPALRKIETVHHTLCADQIEDTIASAIYQWTPLADFLAAVMEIPKLHLMEDPLARVNVIAYRAGEALNWHFDRSQFTTTLLISGCVFHTRCPREIGAICEQQEPPLGKIDQRHAIRCHIPVDDLARMQAAAPGDRHPPAA